MADGLLERQSNSRTKSEEPTRLNRGTITKLDDLFTEFPFMKSEPVSIEEIAKAENHLGVQFSDDYREFIQNYGGAIVGAYPIFGLRHAGPMDENLWSVVDVTMRFRKEGWPSAGELYVVSTDHAGNPIMIANDGAVISYDHDFREIVRVADTFEDFVLQCLR